MPRVVALKVAAVKRRRNITAANWLTWQCQAARIPGRDVIAASDLQHSGALAPAAGHHRLCVCEPS